ncbi:methyltransferase TRM13-domain-containing protein [Halteromyces radiatus]|uniref:methyltransferase TRM13-domain-containing protein n=1 Tax=Halteromyces radiatus TaxID=101107 RepID=UPI00221EFF9B|nr:methyltransferase TRM13-domain-containing protein [Halteromyces radiatus]KAI8100004.1 methyltransferase TRM13-domain-containing protein [Halteromyces radiatus]
MPKEPIKTCPKKLPWNKGDPIPPPPAKQRQCHYWIERKRRYCQLLAKATNKYCGEHMVVSDNNGVEESKRRVPCPFDPSHSVVQKDLEIHKTKCNARPRAPESHYALNINTTLPLSQEELDFQQGIYSHKELKVQPWIARIQLDELSRSELDALINKVQLAYDSHVPSSIPKQVLSHQAIVIDGQSSKAIRHLHQQSSLLGHMLDCGMLDNKKACFIEFGAGKGELSGHLKQALQEENGEATYILVDRKSVRNKYDRSLLGTSERNSKVQRIMIDIKDLQLGKIKSLQGDDNKNKPVVCLSKHLCGSATDITLKCLMNYVAEEKAAGNGCPVSGIIIALCCHQMCRYEMYPNTKYLDSIGLSKLEFDRLCKMTSWAICGKRNVTDESEIDHALLLEEEKEDEMGGHYSGRDHEEREEIGYKCKRVLDAGRLEYLEQHGFKPYLVYYVDKTSTLENCALIAVPQ